MEGGIAMVNVNDDARDYLVILSRRILETANADHDLIALARNALRRFETPDHVTDLNQPIVFETKSGGEVGVEKSF